jgi:hypothetical protein
MAHAPICLGAKIFLLSGHVKFSRVIFCKLDEDFARPLDYGREQAWDRNTIHLQATWKSLHADFY